MQQIPCRSCGQPVPPENINVQNSIAKCGSCNSIFGINAAMFSAPAAPFAAGPPPGSMGIAGNPGWGAPPNAGFGAGPMNYYASGTRVAVPMPVGITVESDGKDLTIHRSWFSWPIIFLAIFCVIWDTIVLVFIGAGVFASTQIGAMGFLFLLIPGLFLLIGACLTYFAICSFVNSTTIRAGAGLVSVTHGPLPWFGNFEVASGDIAQFFTTEHVHHGKRGSVSFTYSVDYVLRSGARQTLASGLSDATQALYIEQELERYLGIQDTPVGGEVRRW